ncbi:hypothetical protein ACIPYS_21275 [Kitasatospora sp. NPDC089913]
MVTGGGAGLFGQYGADGKAGNTGEIYGGGGGPRRWDSAASWSL